MILSADPNLDYFAAGFEAGVRLFSIFWHPYALAFYGFLAGVFVAVTIGFIVCVLIYMTYAAITGNLPPRWPDGFAQRRGGVVGDDPGPPPEKPHNLISKPKTASNKGTVRTKPAGPRPADPAPMIGVKPVKVTREMLKPDPLSVDHSCKEKGCWPLCK